MMPSKKEEFALKVEGELKRLREEMLEVVIREASQEGILSLLPLLQRFIKIAMVGGVDIKKELECLKILLKMNEGQKDVDLDVMKQLEKLTHDI